MAYEQKEGSGTLFKNDKKSSPNQPDFRGEAMYDGKLIELAMWEKETSKGAPMLSIAIKPKQEWTPKQEPKKADPFADDDDLIPF